MFVLHPAGFGTYFFVGGMSGYFYPEPADDCDIFKFCDEWHLYETDLVI